MKRHIAIKGNAERGNEIIELLEMMGGKNSGHFTGRDSSRYYFIDDNKKCICSENIYEMEICCNGVYMLFSYNSFNDDYPWRIGDIVNVIGRNDRIGLKIVKMQWGDAYNTMMYCLDCGEDGYGWWRAEDIEYTKYSDFKVDLNDTVNNNIEFDLTKYSYEVKDGKLIIGEKKHEYPKTYKECCERVNACPTVSISYDSDEDMLYNDEVDLTLLTLRKLLICRNAYWKIVGEELGLDKPWEPDLEDEGLYCIQNYNKQIIKSKLNTAFNQILVFPTEEMKNTFYENFKDLIEQCKELL